MSHVAVRILANWYADSNYGINAIAANVPRVGADAAPPSVTIYNESQHGWVARGLVPDAADATGGISFPMVVVSLQGAQFSAGSPQPTSIASGTYEEATVKLVTQLLLRAAATETDVTNAMYLMRAIRNSIYRFDIQPAATRTLAYTELKESQSITQGKMDIPGGDLICPAAIVSTHLVWETTDVTGQ